MTEAELHLILQKGEGYSLEFKENANSDLSKEMTAFANASGGRIFLGISDDNRVIGIKDSNSLRSNPSFAFFCKISPKHLNSPS